VRIGGRPAGCPTLAASLLSQLGWESTKLRGHRPGAIVADREFRREAGAPAPGKQREWPGPSGPGLCLSFAAGSKRDRSPSKQGAEPKATVRGIAASTDPKSRREAEHLSSEATNIRRFLHVLPKSGGLQAQFDVLISARDLTFSLRGVRLITS